MAADTAHATGRKIAAHAHDAAPRASSGPSRPESTPSNTPALKSDDEGIRLAKRAWHLLRSWTSTNDDYILGNAKQFGIPQEFIEKERGVGRLQRENFRKAVQAGVKMAFGTDAGVYPHGDNAKQFHYMVMYGMSPAQAIQAATWSAADLIGRANDVGSLTPGHYADLIAVTDDPLQHIETLEHVSLVMKGGAVVKNELKGN